MKNIHQSDISSSELEDNESYVKMHDECKEEEIELNSAGL